MANNRMLLLCNVCKPKDEWSYSDREKEGVLYLGKWYPPGAYYTNKQFLEEWGKCFFDFLEQHQHLEVASKYYKAGAGQENPVRLVYENDGLPILEEKGLLE